MNEMVIALLVSWAISTLIILALVGRERSRRQRFQRRVDVLLAQARDASTRYRWAKGPMGDHADWAGLDRTMEMLTEVVQTMEQEQAA